MSPGRRLPRSFFRRPTLAVARGLIGQRLVRVERGRRVSGWIVEAEAYIGQEDLACHAHSGLTERNRVMWGEAGHAYVYFTYGMHWCLNIVTESVGRPAAVLLRALAPDEGLATMQRRRRARPHPPTPSPVPRERGRGGEGLTDGPAKLCQALGVDRRLNGHDLCTRRSQLFVERGAAPRRGIVRGPRVGLNGVPEPWKGKPWRFRLAPEQISLLLEEESV